jgi:hypothetical protein
VDFPGFSNEDLRPAGAVRWLPNCTVVKVRCAQNGGSYGFINTIHDQQVQLNWRRWAQLDRGDWLPLSAVAESTGLRQPILGLSPCPRP